MVETVNNGDQTHAIHVDLTPAQLIQHSLERNESQRAANGALRVETGARTGRSVNDRFIVKEPTTASQIDWGKTNKSVSAELFNRLWDKANHYIYQREHFVSHLRVGADSEHYLPVRVVTEFAWHNLFAQNLFIREAAEGNAQHPEWTILNVPNMHPNPDVDQTHSDAAVIINLKQHRVLICGTRYAGEIKKAMFSVMNFILPSHDILPMHCAANCNAEGEEVALFFGLSGTGKTTLSADPKRLLIGDDEHGWGKNGVFNFEGGCYAKCIDLSAEREPVIWQAIREGAVMENVVLDADLNPDYTDGSLTQNTRVAYPREHIELRAENNRGSSPKAVVFLCCDLYGVLPPVAKLSREQAAYYFLSGYTALMGSTEVGSAAAIKPTFSRCFGAPFFPGHANVYSDLLVKRIDETGCNVYLVNTGWTGGAYQAGGERFSIPTTRAIIDAILDGSIEEAEFATLPIFNFAMPTALSGVESELLDPRQTWADKAAYEENAQALAEAFAENFTQYKVASSVAKAGPSV